MVSNFFRSIPIIPSVIFDAKNSSSGPATMRHRNFSRVVVLRNKITKQCGHEDLGRGSEVGAFFHTYYDQ